MSLLDGTGPRGLGPLTGRGMGWCRGGWGRGYGLRRFVSPRNELSALEAEEKMLEEELAAVREEKAARQSQSK